MGPLPSPQTGMPQQSVPKPTPGSSTWQQQTHPQQIITSFPQSVNPLTSLPIVPGTPIPANPTQGNVSVVAPASKGRRVTRFVALALAGILTVALFLVWHPDPWEPTALRWWDGRQWTGYTNPGPTGAST